MKFFIFCFLSFFFFQQLFASDFDSLFTKNDLAAINKGLTICTVFTSREIPKILYVPPQIKNHAFDYLTLAKGQFKTKESLLAVANLFLHVSKMAGIQYYSVTRNRIETLLEQSYTIADTFSGKKKNDSTLISLPGQISQFIFQKDNKSNGAVYEIVIQNHQDGSLTYQQRNIRPVKQFIIFKIDENDLYRFIRIIPAKEGYYFYVAIRVKLPPATPRKPTAKQSFINRAQAIIEYYRINLKG